jgi:hypothetical protein
MKCNKTIGKWYKNKHGASKIIDTFETYQRLLHDCSTSTFCFHFFCVIFVITMSSKADQAAADKRVADEAAAAASAAATSANWPTGGYYMLIPLLLISMCIVLAISVDVFTICLVLHSYMIKYQYVHVMLMFYSWINIIEKLPRFLTVYWVWLCIAPYSAVAGHP